MHQQVQLEPQAQQRPVLEGKVGVQGFASADVADLLEVENVQLMLDHLGHQCLHRILLLGLLLLLLLALLLLHLFLPLLLLLAALFALRRALLAAVGLGPPCLLGLAAGRSLLLLGFSGARRVSVLRLLLLLVLLACGLARLVCRLRLFLRLGSGRGRQYRGPLLGVLELHVLHVPDLQVPLPLLPPLPEPVRRLQVVDAHGDLAVKVPPLHVLHASLGA
mmetsp:Transcript_68990/g.205326  ORF Transcript_68990/g.205326 Transcript_68990/m.205326 type:complete len:220 (-) Transcript_68990:1248-1907(-)